MGKFVWAQADDINVIFTQKHGRCDVFFNHNQVTTRGKLILGVVVLAALLWCKYLLVQLARRAHSFQYLVKRNAEGSRKAYESPGTGLRVGIYKCGPRGDRYGANADQRKRY